MVSFSFLSGNIRGWAGPEIDGEHAWEFRAPHYAELLRTISPHVVGFQEFHASNLADLSTALPFHTHTLGLESDVGQYVPIFWDTRRFQSVAEGGIWLNRWRDRKALGWDANNERSMTWVELVDRATQARLLVVNTHLDHVGEIARIRGTSLIIETLDDWPAEIPIVVTGDFNCGPYRPIRQVRFSSRPYGLFAEAGFMDAYRSATGLWPPPTTFHDFRGDAYRPDRYGTWYIDWPLTRNLRVTSARILRHPPGTQPLSDHYPVQAIVEPSHTT